MSTTAIFGLVIIILFIVVVVSGFWSRGKNK